MGKTILVSGGAGFIGSHLVDDLVARGHHVRVLDNLDPQVHGSLSEQGCWPSYCHLGAEYILGDVRDSAVFAKALKDVEIVYHLAAVVGVGQSMYDIQRYSEVNIGGTSVLLDILANQQTIRKRVRRVIVASSMSNYGEGEYICPIHGHVYPQLRSSDQLHSNQWEPSCPKTLGTDSDKVCGERLQPVPTQESKPLHATSIYAITKKTQEEMCLTIGEAYSIPTVALRFFNTYGTRQALSNPYTGVAAIFSSRLLNGNPPIIFEDGNQLRDFVHVSDLVQANVLAINEHFPVGVYNVGSGNPISILDVAKTLTGHLGLTIEPKILNQFRAGDIRHCYADVTKIQNQGYVPRMTLEKGIAELVDWIRDQHAEDLFEIANKSLHKRGLTI